MESNYVALNLTHVFFAISCIVHFLLLRYPSDIDKHILARQTGLTRGQVSNIANIKRVFDY